MNRPLEEESVVKLRALAQSLGTPYSWQDDKRALLGKIRSVTEKRTRPPAPEIKVDVVQPIGNCMTREQVRTALKDFEPLGLRVTFPDVNTWELYCNKKRDSGSMTMGTWNLVQAAKEVVKP